MVTMTWFGAPEQVVNYCKLFSKLTIPDDDAAATAADDDDDVASFDCRPSTTPSRLCCPGQASDSDSDYYRPGPAEDPLWARRQAILSKLAGMG